MRRWMFGTLLLVAASAVAQPPEPAVSPSVEPPPVAAPVAEPPPAALPPAGEMNFIELLISGGSFMIPLLLMSVIAVTFTVERLIGLRRSRVIPTGLISALGQLGSATSGFDPRRAYKLCQQYPSSTSTVVRAMLLKVGRPHSELEHTVQETSQREAERLYKNVRWLNLATNVSPLIGLLGTVWGMIIVFRDLTILDPSRNKAEFLAEGIYIALVTTLGGLMIAIPAAIAAHYFEGRIQSLFHQIDELVFNLLPQVERYEGRERFNRHGGVEEPPVAEKATANDPLRGAE